MQALERENNRIPAGPRIFSVDYSLSPKLELQPVTGEVLVDGWHYESGYIPASVPTIVELVCKES